MLLLLPRSVLAARRYRMTPMKRCAATVATLLHNTCAHRPVNVSLQAACMLHMRCALRLVNLPWPQKAIKVRDVIDWRRLD